MAEEKKEKKDNSTEEEEHECDECPPKGAPAWMATFADMATLLMAFFVLILSFAEFNVPKFKQISGSMKNAFGIQRVIPTVEQPKGTTVLSLNFSPNPTPAVTDNNKQQTTETDQPEVELKTKDNDSTKDDGDTESARELAENIKDAVSQGDVDIQVETVGDKVVVNFNPTETDKKEMQEAVQAIEAIKAAQGKSETEVLFGGVEKQLAQLSTASNKQGMGEASSDDGNDLGSSPDTSKEEERKAKLAEDKFKVALKEEMGEGLINIDRQDDKVIITVGSGGAFKSGSADLTSKAKKIMAKIAEVNEKGRSEILVSGHTDDKPLTFGSIYRDNWDLAAARSSSVVQELAGSGKLKPDRMKAISYGETKPLASNDDPKGREKNRRIEIEINY
ncbi:MAG: flagellar motor protein MotB [alpha proteobacterium MED-G10]|nr:MAG: flagellar motor protein MotB [alpha proteobacterium MED-G10]|tara:strand:- start:775 stop:1947 length:1173 start_codon:yes stop_codon:yes gene_type:complete